MPVQSAIITVIERACRKAAAKLRRDFGEVAHLQVSRKGPADFVSKADEAAERTLFQELSRDRPGWGFLMEEGGEVAAQPGMPRFILDPLDGTSNFLHAIPHFAISVAVQEPDGSISAAVVHSPMTDETFWAERSRGAWVQSQRLRVAARRSLAECLIATGAPYRGHGDHGRWLAQCNALLPHVAGIRRFGAASLDLAWVAAGRFDGFWEEGLKPWDIAAGILLVREAGGFVTDLRGGDRALATGDVLAGGEGVHSRLHKLLAEAARVERAGRTA
jgi:myo-inositol-1(or 4)-monophosphatase